MSYAKKRTLGREKEKEMVKPYMGEDGRLKVTLVDKQGNASEKDLAYTVAKAFVPNPNNYEHVDFIDGNPRNCAANNLKWVE